MCGTHGVSSIRICLKYDMHVRSLNHTKQNHSILLVEHGLGREGKMYTDLASTDYSGKDNMKIYRDFS